MTATPPPLFVYGTLRDSDVLEMVTGKTHAAAGARPALLAGYRVERAAGRTYPMIVEDPAGTADGLVLERLDATDRAALDAFEGAGYRRVAVTVRADGADRAAEVYLPTEATPASGEPWSLEAWRRTAKARWLTTGGID